MASAWENSVSGCGMSDESRKAADKHNREVKKFHAKMRAKAARAAKRAAYESLGMVRVRGALGGTYYE